MPGCTYLSGYKDLTSYHPSAVALPSSEIDSDHSVIVPFLLIDLVTATQAAHSTIPNP